MWDKSTQQHKRGWVRGGEFIMKRPEQITNRVGGLDLWMTVAATAIATLLIVAATSAQGQTYTVHLSTVVDITKQITVNTPPVQ